LITPSGNSNRLLKNGSRVTASPPLADVVNDFLPQR
jgi:hypothetical protein